jgi:molybdenum cofactor cytidylyltransferase
MRLQRKPVSDALGTILMHNIADGSGFRSLKKGIFLTEAHLAQLAEMGWTSVDVAVLDLDDVHEDEAAAILARAMQTEPLYLSQPAAGRVNLRTRLAGLLEVDAERLLQLNLIPGITLATRRPQTVVGPRQETDNVGTVKIIPFAVPRRLLDQALALAEHRPGIVEVRPFQPGRRVAMLLIGEPATHDRLRNEYLPATQARLERLQANLVAVEAVVQESAAIGQAAHRLAEAVDLIIVASQTSVQDEDDTVLCGLRSAGAEATLCGAPVEPGNLLALAYFPRTPVLCAPGSAKGLRRNAIDLVLPRLLLGDRLDRRDVAALGLGGFLAPVECGEDLV